MKLFIVLFIILLISIMGCVRSYPYNNNESVAAHKLSQSLQESYSNNPVRFNEFYVGDTVYFHGKVSRINRDSSIYFSGGFFMYSLVCIFNNKEDVININPSDKIYVKGQIQEKNRKNPVYIENCEFVH